MIFSSNRVYVDCDGVLADFDLGFERACGAQPRDYEKTFGAQKFWKRIEEAPEFYRHLPLMSGAVDLIDFLRPYRPIILTGLPMFPLAAWQKLNWRDRFFPDIIMAPCAGKNKHLFCEVGDILIDDWDKYRESWQNEGGIFIHHNNSTNTIDTLRRLLS